ncbi:MAG: tyrosine-type recombinase/integrase [Clostridia bacterium]|nr:tyrosine-type recombinase/integrase [Clostridia bacterium]
MEYRDYPYQSILAPYIRNFLEEKRGLGFIYNGMAYQLFRLDQYWSLHGYQSMDMSPERLDDWIKALPSEGKSSQRGRICAIRSFGSYLIALGLNSYIPLVGIGGDHPVVHILTKDELRQLFEVIDSYIPKTRCKADLRMANEYPLIFRLLYCCGMRNNEVCSLKMSAIDFNAGIIELQDTKNQKDRLVYCPADLLKLLQQYHHWIIWTTGYEPYWLFPGRNLENHIPKTTIDKVFKEFWEKTSTSENCEKDPTPHSLRHTFVVDRLNSWILERIDITVMSAYLSKYLGHQSWDESIYYYHLVDDAFKIVKSRDTMSPDVIPEVRRR